MRRAVGLLLSAQWTKDIDRLQHGHGKPTAPPKLRPHGAIQICLLLLLLAANAGSVTSTAEAGG